MRIALITDLHTGMEKEAPFQVDLRKNLQDLIVSVSQCQPDLLVIAGDLCLNDGDSDIYQWQKKQLELLTFPYFIIAGNHDDPQLLSQIFDHLPTPKDGEIFYEQEIQNQPLIFLDTHRGFMSSHQKMWLRRKIHEQANGRLMVFMHHPPDLMNVPHMDASHSLQDREEVLKILKASPVPVDVFCGHYHVEKSVSNDPVNIYVTPSAYFQIDDRVEEFRILHKDIAYRLIDIQGSRLEHAVHYLPGNEV